MKKIAVLLLSLVMLLTMVPFGVVNAAESPTIYVSEVTGVVGSTVSVDVLLKNNPGIISLKILVGYDSTALELVSKTPGTYYPRMSYSKDLASNPYVVNWVDAINPDVTSENFITLTFKVKDNAEAGNYPITVTYDQADVFNASWDDVVFATDNGCVNVVKCLHENITEYAAVASTCISQGHGKYIICNDCGAVISGSADKLPLADHNIKYCAAIEPTHLTTGNKAYWQCAVCDTCFADANGNKIIQLSDVIIDKIPHVYDDIYDVDCECGFTREAVSVEILEWPTKTKYIVGQNVCLAGLVVNINYNDGTSGVIDKYTVSAFDSKTSGEKFVTVSYGDLSAAFKVTVLSADTAAFVIDDQKAKAGDTIDVKVRLYNNPGFTSAKLLIGYDTDVLELVEANGGKDFPTMSFGPVENNPFVVNWVDSINPDNMSNEEYVILTFKVKDDARIGNTVITIDYDPNDVFDSSYTNVNFECVYGLVDVIEYVSGDPNGDGIVNNKDLGLLMQYLNGWNVNITLDAADVNGDGVVNNKDYGLLMQYLNGWDVKFK